VTIEANEQLELNLTFYKAKQTNFW